MQLDVQRHAMYCLWVMDQGNAHMLPAWLTTSLKGDWCAPRTRRWTCSCMSAAGAFWLAKRDMPNAHFPYLTAEQIVMGAKPDQKGQIYLAPRDQIVSDYNYEVQLPHASSYTEK